MVICVANAHVESRRTSIGIDFSDAALEAAIRTFLVRVEELLRTTVVSADPLVTDAARHLVDAGGKRFRPLLVGLAAQFGGAASAPEVVKAAGVVELTHLATLYHDDVMDEAPVRRGAESANSRWGNAIAILTGDYLFSRAADLAAELGVDAVRIQAATFSRLVHGQIAETSGPRGGVPRVPTSRRWPGTARRSASRSSSPTICWTSRRSPNSRARRPAPTCAKVCQRYRCCTRWRPMTPTRRPFGCGRSSPPVRSPTTPCTPRRWACCVSPPR
jgi:hypothetical protein